MSDTSWILQIDPPAIAPERTMLDLNSGPIVCGTDSGGSAAIDWGQVAVTEYLSQQGQYGSTMASFVLPNRTITINLLLGGQGYEAEQETARSQLAQKVALLQREGGQLLRQRIGGPAMYADIIDAQLTVPDIYGETGGIEPDVQLVLICLPDFYGDEQPAGVMLASNEGLLNSLLVEEVVNYVANPSFAYDIVGGPIARWSSAASDFLVAGAVLTAATLSSSHGIQPLMEISTTGTVNQGAEISLGVMPAGDYVLTFNVFTADVSEIKALIGPHSGTPNTTTISGLTNVPEAQTIEFTASGVDEIFVAFCSQGTLTSGVFIYDVMAGLTGTFVDGDSPGYGWASSAGASQTVIPFTVDGDYPARCRIVLSETAGQDRHGLIYGLRSRHYDDASSAQVFYEAETLTPINGATIAEVTGASGEAVTYTIGEDEGDEWLPFLLTNLAGGTPMTQQGTYRVLARCAANEAVSLRLVWSVGSLAVPIFNNIVALSDEGWYLVDLGPIRLDPLPVGLSAWFGVLQVYGAVGAIIDVDQIILDPLDEGAGEMVYVPQVSLTPPPTVEASNEYGGSVAQADSDTSPVPWSIVSSSTNGELAILSSAVGGAAGGYTKVLQCADFGFAVPDDATILGVVVTYEYSILSGGYIDSFISLANASGYYGNSGASGATRSTQGGPFTVGYGGAATTWGASLTPAEVNDAAFGCAIQWYVEPQVVGGTDFFGIIVQDLVMTVYYQLESGFAIPDDAVLYAYRKAELRTEGPYRTYDGTVYGPIRQISGDLPRLPASGVEGRPVELLVRPSRGDFNTELDSGFDDFTAQVLYRPCWLSRP